jgi:rSAM/selenodomain-associated transferase 2/rSAM/selenodomain-associated transferase 1
MKSATPHRLIVFGRYPRPGKTKTRLIPALGPVGAAELQRRLTERTVAVAKHCLRRTGARLAVHHDGGSRKQMQHWLGKRDIDYVPQARGDLGGRMFRSLQWAFDQGARRVVLVGTDIPGLAPAHLEAAFDRLERHDLVIGPSKDGGYWLVGMSCLENLFGGIAWSTATVLATTLNLARSKGMTNSLLDPLSDLDNSDDLDREGLGKTAAQPYISIVVPSLNEEQRLAATLDGARSADAEIIVSDGGSTDRTVAVARAHGARVIEGPMGRSAQQNRGAAAAEGRVLLFLHADTLLPANYVDHVFETLMDRRVVLGAFRFQTDLATPAMHWIAFWTQLRAAWLRLPYGDQGLFLRRRDFWAAGGFPQVPIAEDLYLVRRLAGRGRIALAAAPVVTSARRWREIGPLRTTLINTAIALGCLSGVDPARLAPLYRLSPGKKRP